MPYKMSAEKALAVVEVVAGMMRVGANGETYEVIAESYFDALATLRKEFTELLEKNKVLNAELDELRADAERLDWLESCGEWNNGRWRAGPETISGDTFRAAIDAARNKENSHEP